MLTMCACGNGAGNPDATLPDAVPEPDVAPLPGPEGLWNVTQYSELGTPLGTTGPDRVNGTLEMTDDGVLGHGIVVVRGGRLEPNTLLGGIRPYTRTGATIQWGATTFTWDQGPPETLHLMESPLDVLWGRHTHTSAEVITVQGQISFAGSAPLIPIVTPRVGLVFLLRAAGPPGIIEVPGGDAAIGGFGSDIADTATFDLSRTEGALGVERITFGSASASIGLVVVYDDVNGNGMLDTLWTSCGAGEDCVRGVSTLVLAYRVGSSQELADSPYAFVRAGWTPATMVLDFRPATAALGLISVDRSAEVVPFDVQVPTDPAAVTLPALEL
jgi:hypothetical protein